MTTKFQWKLEEKYHFGKLDVDGKIKKNWFVKYRDLG
jgi:hypothetical protein